MVVFGVSLLCEEWMKSGEKGLRLGVGFVKRGGFEAGHADAACCEAGMKAAGRFSIKAGASH